MDEPVITEPTDDKTSKPSAKIPDPPAPEPVAEAAPYDDEPPTAERGPTVEEATAAKQAALHHLYNETVQGSREYDAARDALADANAALREAREARRH